MSTEQSLLNKRFLLFLTIFITINLLTFLLLLPYAQRSANTHMSEAPFLGVLYFTLATLTAAFAVKRPAAMGGRMNAIAIVCITLSFLLWGLRLYFLTCEKCAASG